MKYKITKDDLKKRRYFSNDFLVEDQYERIDNAIKTQNPIFSNVHIAQVEKKILKSINSNIYTYSFFGILATLYGGFMFFNMAPRLAVNLYTHFPLIENGTFPIILGLAFFVGSIHSYIKKTSILETKVKAVLIEKLDREHQEKVINKTNVISKKRKRFRQKFTGHKKKIN